MQAQFKFSAFLILNRPEAFKMGRSIAVWFKFISNSKCIYLKLPPLPSRASMLRIHPIDLHSRPISDSTLISLTLRPTPIRGCAHTNLPRRTSMPNPLLTVKQSRAEAHCTRIFTQISPGKTSNLSNMRTLYNHKILCSTASFQPFSAGEESGECGNESKRGRCCEGESDATIVD